MNPAYKFRIDVIVAMHKTHRNLTLRKEMYLEFVPQEGMNITFRNDEQEELEITLINLHYDYEARTWIEEQEDDTLIEELKEPDRPECTVLPARIKEYSDHYKSFGWDFA